MDVSIIGTGYVGLVTGVCLAAKGHRVTCHDMRQSIVDSLNAGEPHIHERGLPDLLKQLLAEGIFSARLMDEAEFEAGDVTIVAVGTPTTDGEIDLSQVEGAARMLGRIIRDSERFVSVVIKSTVVPGTTDTVVRNAIEAESGKKLGDGFGLGMNPEFLREGEAIEDFTDPDRVVLGHDDPETLNRLRRLYAPWDCEKVEVNTRTAEMIKYANNCLLATQISAVNELANIAAATRGIDIMEVMNGVHLDKRWNPILKDRERAEPGILSYLVPGCGFGGSCFPKDVQAMRRHAEKAGIRPHVLDSVLAVNADQPLEVIRLLEGALHDLPIRRIMILGLAFKPNTDDVRESVSLRLIDALKDRCVELILHDPMAQQNCAAHFPAGGTIRYVSDWKSEIDGVGAVIVATKWQEYEQLAMECALRDQLAGKPLIDARRMFRPEDFERSEYLTIGRAQLSA